MKFIALFVLILFALPLPAQDIQGQKARLAASYEQNGEMEEAARIYKELFDSSKKPDYLLGIVRTYKAMGKYKELLEICLPLGDIKDPMFHDLLAELYKRTGKEGEAMKSWARAMDHAGSDAASFLAIAQTQSSLNLNSEAIRTLTEARNRLNNPLAFSDELSKFYMAEGNIAAAFSEMINFLLSTRNLPQTQGRLYALLTNKSNEDMVFREFARALEYHGDNFLVLELYTWALRTVDKYDEALDAYVELDELKGAEGQELVNFASLARTEGKYDVAQKAYKILMDRGKSGKFYSQAMYGYAKTTEAKLANSQKLSPDELAQITEGYRQVINEFPKSQTAADAQFQIAELMNAYSLSLSETIDAYLKFLADYPTNRLAGSVCDRLFMLYLKSGDLAKAAEYNARLQGSYTKQNAELAQTAKYNKGLLLFYTEKTDSAKLMFLELTANPNTVISNDALNKLFLIDNSKTNIEGLHMLARAELCSLQNKATELVQNVDHIVAADDMPLILKEYSLLMLARYQVSIGRNEDALISLGRILELNEKSIYGDEAFMMLARIYFAQNKKDMAKDYYAKVLSLFPNSIYLNEAREAIRRIRGEI